MPTIQRRSQRAEVAPSNRHAKAEKGKLFMMDWVIVGDCSRWDLGELGLLAGRNGAVWGRGGRRDCGRRLP
jgi:hypothetical protein